MFIDAARGTEGFYALVLSVLAHAAVLAVSPFVAARELDEPVVAARLPMPESGGGDTFEIDGLVDDDRSAIGDVAPRTESPSEANSDQAARGNEQTASEPPPPAARPAAAHRERDLPEADVPTEHVYDKPPRAPKRRKTLAERLGLPASPAGGADATPGDNGEGKGRHYGAAGLPRGVRNIAGDFARALPAAVSADRVWSRRALGSAGEVEVVLSIDDQGRIEDHAVPHDTPLYLEDMVSRTVALLHGGRFALTAAPGRPGKETLRIAVTLSKRDPIEQEGSDPHHALNLGHEPPEQDRPGKAYFTLASGRHFEAEVTIVASVGEASAEADPPASADDAAEQRDEPSPRD